MNLDHPLNCLTFNLQRATRNLVRRAEAALKQDGLTAPQFTTLAVLSGFGSQTISEMAAHLGTERTTLTRNLAVMEREGWLAPVPSTDQRLHAFELTESGRARLNTAMPAWTAFQRGLVAELGVSGAHQLLGTIQKF